MFGDVEPSFSPSSSESFAATSKICAKMCIRDRLCDSVIAANETAYPELKEKETFIKKVIAVEEESFNRTVDQGLSLLEEMLQNTAGEVLSGDDAFKLSDTYGFPLDLTREIVAERGKIVDEERFHELMREQKERCLLYTSKDESFHSLSNRIASITIYLDRKAGQPVRLSLHLVPKLQ